MSTLHKRIEADFIIAYKAREEIRINVLRLLKAALKNRRVELGRDLDDNDVLDMVARQLKQRLESVEQFTAAGRADMAQREAAEADLLRAYMPEPLSGAEVLRVVEETIAALGASGMKDMGRVMAAITAEHKGRVDGKAVSALVRERLSS